MRTAGMSLILALAAGCAQFDPNILNYDNLTAETHRDYREAFFEIPFSDGPISVVVAESGSMRTYTLGSCGQSICGGTGRSGALSRTPDYWVVTGAYSGRSFYLAPGGDGYMLRNGAQFPLAWE